MSKKRKGNSKKSNEKKLPPTRKVDLHRMSFSGFGYKAGGPIGGLKG